MSYICANFSFPGPLSSRVRPDVRDRQTDRRQADIRRHRLMPPPIRGGACQYATLQTHCDFHPIAVETLGPINESATSFLYDLGRRISLVSGEDRESQCLFQRISVAIQRFNAVLLHDGFCLPTTRITVCFRLIFFIVFSFLRSIPTEA